MALPVNIDDLVNHRKVEWARIEYKEGWNPEKVLHTLCAFANDIDNWGGGYVILGVAEQDGKPVVPMHPAFKQGMFNGLETSQKIALKKQRPLNADNLPKSGKGVSITAEEELCLVADRLKDAWKISQEISQKNLSAKSLDRWSRIVQAILRDGSVAALILAQQLHATYRTIQSDMRILKTLEVIRRDGPDKGGKWIVTLKI